jgi:hypothetical protein
VTSIGTGDHASASGDLGIVLPRGESMLQNAEELVTTSRLTHSEPLTPRKNSGIAQSSLDVWTLTVLSLSKEAGVGSSTSRWCFSTRPSIRCSTSLRSYSGCVPSLQVPSPPPLMGGVSFA